MLVVDLLLHLVVPHAYLLFERHGAADSVVFIARAGGLLLMIDCIHCQLFLVKHIYLAVALRLREAARLESHVVRLNEGALARYHGRGHHHIWSRLLGLKDGTTVGLLRNEHVEGSVAFAYLGVWRIRGSALLSAGESIVTLIGGVVSIGLQVAVVVGALHHTGHHAGRGARCNLFGCCGCGPDLDQVRCLLGLALALAQLR